jgi:hypothetical protein
MAVRVYHLQETIGRRPLAGGISGRASGRGPVAGERTPTSALALTIRTRVLMLGSQRLR